MDIPLTNLKARLTRFSMEPAPDYIGRKLEDGTMQWGGWPSASFSPVDTVAEADAVWFLCPACFVKNGGPVGTHSIRIDFAGRRVPDSECMKNDSGQPVRWTVSGTDLSDLVLSPSIQMLGGCNWHGFVGRTHPGRVENA